MKRTVVRYRTKPEMADENQRLIENVFAELQTKSPEGIRYLVMKLGDGKFIHFVIAESDDGASPLPQLEPFSHSATALRSVASSSRRPAP